eukprot:2690449-Amphidinium_carterae.1
MGIQSSLTILSPMTLSAWTQMFLLLQPLRYCLRLSAQSPLAALGRQLVHPATCLTKRSLP